MLKLCELPLAYCFGIVEQYHCFLMLEAGQSFKTENLASEGGHFLILKNWFVSKLRNHEARY